MAEAKQGKSESSAAPKAAPKAKKPAAVGGNTASKGAAPKAAAPKAHKAAKVSAGPKVKVRLVRSGIGTPKDQRATLKGLGLAHLNQERELLDSAPLRGMLRKVRHLVSVDGKPAA